MFKVGDRVRVTDWNNAVGTVVGMEDDLVVVNHERELERLYCDEQNLELVTEPYDKAINLPIFADWEGRKSRRWERVVKS